MLVVTCPTCQFRFGIPDRVPAERLRCPLCTRRMPPLAPGEGVRVDTGTVVSPAPAAAAPASLDFTESDETFSKRLRLVSALRAVRDWLLVPAVLTTILAMCPLFVVMGKAQQASMTPGAEVPWAAIIRMLVMAACYYLPPILIIAAVYRLQVRKNHAFVRFATLLAIALMVGMFVHAAVAAVAIVRLLMGPAADDFGLGIEAGNLWVTAIWLMLAPAVAIVGLIGAVRAFSLLGRPDVKEAFR